MPLLAWSRRRKYSSSSPVCPPAAAAAEAVVEEQQPIALRRLQPLRGRAATLAVLQVAVLVLLGLHRTFRRTWLNCSLEWEALVEDNSHQHNNNRGLTHVGAVSDQEQEQGAERAMLAAGTVLRRMHRRVSSGCWPCLGNSNRVEVVVVLADESGTAMDDQRLLPLFIPYTVCIV